MVFEAVSSKLLTENAVAGMPPIDALAPKETATATFGLG